MSKKKPSGQKSGLSGVLGTAVLMGIATPILVIPACWIIFNAGIWWIPLLFGYLSLFFIATGYLLSQKSMIEERAQIGEELFFRTHPAQRETELRQVRRRPNPHTAAVVEEFNMMTPLANYDGNWEEREKHRRKGILLYQAAGAVAVLIAACLVISVILDGRAGRFGVPEIVSLIAMVFLVVSAVNLFQYRNVPLLFLATGLVLFVAAWSRLTLVLKSGFTVSESRLVEYILYTILFVTVSSVLPRKAVKQFEIADAQDLDRKLQLELFELGAISEDDLRYRMKTYY